MRRAYDFAYKERALNKICPVY